jgi:hypothetical protein
MNKPDDMNKPSTHCDLSRPIIIRCCKDRTLTWYKKGQPAFNDRALPVFSVNTPEEAQELIVTVCRVQYAEHPDLPGRPWRKITLENALDLKPYLEIEDLDAVSKKLFDTHGTLKVEAKVRKPKRQRPQSRANRWAYAVSNTLTALETLLEIQQEYQEWQGNLPENLKSSALGEKLDAVCDLDIEGVKSTVEEAGEIDLPIGFGRD